MQNEKPDTGDILSSETEPESDSEEDVKLSSSPNVITVSCCENVADVSIQTDTCKPVVTCCCDKVLQKLEEVLDGSRMNCVRRAVTLWIFAIGVFSSRSKWTVWNNMLM